MENNTQMPPVSPTPQMPSANFGSRKMIIVASVIIVASAAVVGWWWMLRSGNWSQLFSAPTASPAPATETSNQDMQELNSINANENLDVEFQQIDQDLNNL